LRDEGVQLLLDAGNGSMSNLYAFTTPDLLDAVVLSHEHTDHLADFVGLFHYRRYASTPTKRLVLYCTEGVLRTLRTLISDSSIDELVEVIVLEDGLRVAIGPLLCRFVMVTHSVETYGVQVRSRDGAVFSYTSDSGPCEALEDLSDGADLLLSESTWLAAHPSQPTGLHLSAELAGGYAQRGRVRHLVLTHVAYPNSPLEALAVAQRAAPDLRVDLAMDRASFTIVHDTPNPA
jgi:ribonuclease BN (tRNA processing enzyme)